MCAFRRLTFVHEITNYLLLVLLAGDIAYIGYLALLYIQLVFSLVIAF